MRRAARGLLLGMLVAACATEAAEQSSNPAPVLRITTTPATVVVGEPVKVSVSVLVPTWFTEPPSLPQYELPNAVIRRSANESRPISERIGADTWSGVKRDFFVYPQIAARFVIDERALRVSYADPATRAPHAAELRLPAVAFTSRIPLAAGGLRPFLSASELSLRQDVDGGGTPLAVGEVLTRRVEAAWTGMPAMFLPPLLAAPAADGLSVYADEPELTESVDVVDGRITAVRTETHRYEFERPGTYVLPAVALAWWNSADGTVHHSSVPAVTVTVTAGGRAPRDWIAALSMLIALALVAGLRWRRRPSDKARPRVDGERAAFLHLLLAVAGGHAASVQRRLELWLERLQPTLTGVELARAAAAPMLNDMSRKLGAARFGRRPVALRLRVPERLRFAAALLHARARYRRAGRSRGALPPLNPRVTVGGR